jgi:hypothetical protein
MLPPYLRLKSEPDFPSVAFVTVCFIHNNILVGKLEVNRPLGKARRRWEIMSEDVDWMPLTQDRYQWWALVNTLMNLRVP